MISFENTEIAFQSKSDKDLERAYWLFKIVGSPTMVKFGKWGANVALSAGLPIKGLIRKTIFRQFCGGESIATCEETIKTLSRYGVGTILDYSVEGKTSEEDFDSTVEEIIRTIEKAEQQNHIPFAVFKVTGIARFGIIEKANPENAVLSELEKAELSSVIERIDRICKTAHSKSIPVFIDAEETWIQDTIDRIALDMMRKYNKEKAIVFNTLQMYRHDRLAFLNESIATCRDERIKLGIKLVRGAYMEKERERALKMGYTSPIQPDKESTDRDFDLALELMMKNLLASPPTKYCRRTLTPKLTPELLQTRCCKRILTPKLRLELLPTRY